MQNVKEILFICLGAASYGVLATFVKIANNHGAETGALTFAQFLIGFVVLFLVSLLQKKKKDTSTLERKPFSKLKLMAAGTSLGLTSTFYYISLQYIAVSVSIILLMQAIWMGIVLEMILSRTLPSTRKILGAVTVLLGTLLAVDVFNETASLSWQGLVYGLLAAMSYTVTMLAANRTALHLSSIDRSMYLLLGGLIAILVYWNVSIIEGSSLLLFVKWGLFLAVFGTILPPYLFNRGFPVVGIGLGSIISAIEIPISILSAYIFLHEQVAWIQWLGVLIIILSIVLINYRKVG